MYILSIDHGTSGIKCGIFDGKAQAVDFEFERTETLYLEDGGIEQDPQTWWDAIVKTASALTKRNPEIAKEIKAVSVSSTFSTTVAVNHDGEPICNALTWMDSRGEVAVKELMSGAVNVLGYSVGNLMAFLPKTGGAPTLSGKDDIAHVLFWKKNH